jgi:hypothetical protein
VVVAAAAVGLGAAAVVAPGAAALVGAAAGGAAGVLQAASKPLAAPPATSSPPSLRSILRLSGEAESAVIGLPFCVIDNGTTRSSSVGQTVCPIAGAPVSGKCAEAGGGRLFSTL